LKKKFSLYTNEEKIKIKTLGRPVPDLNLIKVTKLKSRQYTRHFTNDYYSKYNWLVDVMLEMLFFVSRVFYLVENFHGQKRE
jgi:hypothetical protein